jgi:uncharacterized protein (DUF952 family)
LHRIAAELPGYGKACYPDAIRAARRQDPVPIIYKIVHVTQWREAQRTGIFLGSSVDHRDGFIHFSARDQVAETAVRHFAGQRDLLLVGVQADRLAPELKWERSRGGALFPHLYGPLRVSAVALIEPLPLDQNGCPVLPELQE